MENDNILVDFNKRTGQLEKITYKTGRLKKKSYSISHEFFLYDGDRSLDNHYTFKHQENSPAKNVSSTDEYYFTHGFAVQTITRKVGKNLIVKYSICGDDDFIRIETITGKIQSNKNLVVRYKVQEINNEGKFWTDDNGYQFIERNYNNASQEIYAKFAPMVYGAIMSDSEQQLSILTDTPEGIAYNNGSLEILMHRNSMQRDGNGESMNDIRSATINHILRFDVTKKSKINTLFHRQLALFLNFPPLFVKCKKAEGIVLPRHFEGTQFPPNIHLMTFQMYDNDQNLYGFRLLHQLQSSIEYSLNRRFTNKYNLNLNRFFGDKFHSLEERTLSFNAKYDQCYKESWNNSTDFSPRKSIKFSQYESQKNITIDPLEIKSFFVRFN